MGSTKSKSYISWCDSIEEGALKQIGNIINLPFIFKHAAIMPDCHQGYGMPIGVVLATKDVIIPNAVGVDIGCGMVAYKTNINANNIPTNMLKSIMTDIRSIIPVGMNRHKRVTAQNELGMPQMLHFLDEPVTDKKREAYIFELEYESACTQIGTLGGGNHFIEFQKDKDDIIWIMIHSGSRNLGKKVADYYNQKAVELNTIHYSCVPKEWDLAFLPLELDLAKRYITEMNYCVEFAKANRALMMKRIVRILQDRKLLSEDVVIDSIDIAHNYARLENHFDENVWIHRKGATSARKDELGIIPGSQGTSSYIIKGKGEKLSFMSCSHGAGRQMSRVSARENLDLYKQIELLDKKGIIHSIRDNSDLDEAPDAYKNIYRVMEKQQDLVDIIYKLEPLAVIKGS